MLGRGGMGVVYKAWHLRLNRAVALKMLLAGAYARPEELERSCARRRRWPACGTPTSCRSTTSATSDGRPYFTMEFVEGGSLAQKSGGPAAAGPQGGRAGRRRWPRPSTPPTRAASSTATSSRPTSCSTADGTPKVTDFGLARRLEGGGGLTLSGAPLGTPSYMAPEQARGRHGRHRAGRGRLRAGGDPVRVLTGRPPFRAETAAATLQQVLAEEPAPPARLNRSVPRDLETICLKCLHKEPARRYASARELADDLRRFLEGKPVRARPVGAAERAVKWARRRPAAALLVAALLVMVGAAVGTGVWMRQQEADRRAAKEQRRRTSP